jgi:serine/threonine-protein kinase
MGTVYRAVDETLDREVAIKVLHSSFADLRVIARFRSEATTLARLNHPEIATLYELFQSKNAMLLVMELVRGETLESICGRMHAMPAPTAAALVHRILSALDHAHRAGIVHCDIKPANVMLTGGGGIKIMDFGTARMPGPRADTRERITMGTPAYMAPEQVLGHDVDGRTDLYAIGVVLYRLLTAELPFSGDSALAVAKQQVAQEPTPVRAHHAELPEWCDQILQRALAKLPADRFQTAGEFCDALRNATGMTPAELNQALVEISINVPELSPRARPAARTRPERAGTRRKTATSTVVLEESNRTLSLFRGVVRRRTRDIVPKSRRAFLVGLLAAALVAETSVLAIAGRHRPAPAAAPAPPDPSPLVFHARSCAPRGARGQDTTCRVELSDERISVRTNATNKQLHDVAYREVRSVSYAHGFDRPSDAPRVSLRTTRAKSELIVLRFDHDAPARQAVGEIEKRTDKRITPSRETPESAR